MKKFLLASFMTMQIVFFLLPMQSVAYDEITTIIVHYQEEEDNDKDWNLWAWPVGKEGQAYYFTEEDNFGKVVTVTFEGLYDEVGFIIRTDAWEKDTGNDRFIKEFNNGVAEIWITGGAEEFTYENPNGPAGITTETVDMNLHINMYSGTYDNITAEVYSNEENIQNISFSNTDEFGVYTSLELKNTLDDKAVYVIVKKNDKEIGKYQVKKIKDKNVEVYLVENQDRVYYSESDAVYKPLILEAKLDNSSTITIETNMPFIGDSIEVLVNGKKVSVGNIEFDKINGNFYATKGKLLLSDKVKYTDKIEVNISKFNKQEVRLGEIYDTKEFDEMFTYDGDDLGNTYSSVKTSFKLWAPTASSVNVILYDAWDSKTGKSYEMEKSDKGTWQVSIDGDLHNQLYMYEVSLDQEPVLVVDPYARAVSANGIKSAVVDLKRTNPEGWNEDYDPDFDKITNAIMYEIHVRDLSMHSDSGIKNKGKFLAFTEEGTKTKAGYSTGIDYIKELGVTHIQLLPIYDYGSINEVDPGYSFNWGYDPVNYNAIEGSYSTDAFTPDVRIRELKAAIKSIHDNDLKVTMDVVYNHVFSLQAMAFEKIVPGYYFRKSNDGNYSNGSGCGNETASERPMMRKFMIDSVKYLSSEYNLDGFRFDLMGLHDVETMNLIRSELDPNITIIGEGWNMGDVLGSAFRANQNQADEMKDIAHFNDTIRDGLKGSVFNELDKGFVNGKEGMESVVFSGIVGGINYSDSINTWGDIEPDQSVTYVEAHDNHTLYDKLKISNSDDDKETIKKMHMLADSIVLTSQGVTFIHAGQEFMRSKLGDHNSYKSSDIINRLDWKRREKNDDVIDYFKGLIKLRKEYSAFRMDSSEEIRENLILLEASDNVIAYYLKENVNNDSDIVVIHNANKESKKVMLPDNGDWDILVENDKAGIEVLRSISGDSINADELSTIVLVKQAKSSNLSFFILLGSAVVIILLFVKIKKK